MIWRLFSPFTFLLLAVSLTLTYSALVNLGSESYVRTFLTLALAVVICPSPLHRLILRAGRALLRR